MITITPTKTPVEIRLTLIDEQLQFVENYTKGASNALNCAMDLFWNTEDSLLLEILNAKGPTAVQEIFDAHERNAQALNALLADRGIAPMAKIGAQKQITVNDQGLFEMVVVEEVVEEPVVEEPV